MLKKVAIYTTIILAVSAGGYAAFVMVSDIIQSLLLVSDSAFKAMVLILLFLITVKPSCIKE